MRPTIGLSAVVLTFVPFAAGCGGSDAPPEYAAVESTWGALGDGKKFAICEDAVTSGRGVYASDALAEETEKRHPDEFIGDDLYASAGFFLNGQAKGYSLNLQRGGFNGLAPPADPCSGQRSAAESAEAATSASESAADESEAAAQAAQEAAAAEEAALRDPSRAILIASSGDTTPATLARLANATTDAGVACVLIKNPNLPEPAFELLRVKRYVERNPNSLVNGAPLIERVQMCLAESPGTPEEVRRAVAKWGDTKAIRQTARANLR